MGAGNSNFGFSSGGSSIPVVNTDWLLDGNSESSEKYFGTNNNFSIPIYTNGVARGIFAKEGNFGFGTVTPNSTALLDLTSTSSGLLVPRMTTLQRDAIVNPATSLFIYNISSSFFNYWDGATWIQVDTSTGGDVSGSGTTNYAVKWTDGANSVIGDGTWYFSGNSYLPVTSGSNIGDATHRIGTIFLASIFDYSNNLTWFNGTSTTMTLTTSGNLGIGISPTAKVHIQGSDSLVGTSALKIEDILNTSLLHVRNNGYVTINGLNIGKGVNQISSSTAFGVSALSVATGIENTAIGYQALRDTTTGVTNTAIGNNALLLNTIGVQNTAIGYNSGRGGIISNNNTSIGFYTLFNNTGDNNTAIGDRASYGNTTGAQNVAIGRFSLYTNLIGQHNVAIGHNALNLNTSSGSVAIGSGASAQATGANLVSVGRDSFAELTTGAQNTVLGWNSGRGITTGSNNTVIGSNITGLTTTLSNSILIGDSSGLVTFYTNSSGDTMIGAGFISASSRLHVRGIDATALNYVLKLEDISSSPLLYVQNNGYVGIGVATPNNKIQVSGLIDFNPATVMTAIGGNALISNTTGSRNVAVGYVSLTANTIGDYNTSIGGFSCFSLVNGSNNVALGMGSLVNLTSGGNNTAIGYASLTDSINGDGNVAIGYFSGYYETGSNKFYVDNTNRLNEANGRIQSLIYGIFGATPDVQRLRVNANLGVNIDSLAMMHVYGIDTVTKSNQRLEPVLNVIQDITGNTVGTIDATANVTAQTITMPLDGNVSIESTIVYRKTAGAGVGTVGDGTTIVLNTSVRSVAGVLTLDTIQNTYTGTVNAIVGCTATFTISGSDILVSVTGVLNDSITWNVISKLNTVI